MDYSFLGVDPLVFSQFFTVEFMGVEQLMAAEKALIKNATVKRQRDFSTGRYCARKALESFGAGDQEILIGKCRQPLWPDGFIGSISHSKSMAGAIVAKTDDIVACGLDIETIGGISRDMWDLLFLDNEKSFLDTLSNDDDQALWSTLIFSFKEAFYKLQYPLTQQYLDFKDVKIHYLNGNFKLTINDVFKSHQLPVEQLFFQWNRIDKQVICICYLRH